ncbi:PREDICTED: protein BREAKING OF ASYMMETRY IN THE STOMATAL LINEAGE isoform X2 [Lupinus angustifolius]|uniref:protein BREAKING OF ASYMMETRY IN THE STOMATAL LINEAGE isoform X2 n=1 Tax=Lupinus angustifolius TaxID=3871 RepID=UPI00092E4AC8|nr:PREDICTED: protein BREAKING OF ASYMMETRY IN THE STOMATAL LINEAGE isoform X2 [Lupinus angustifolius]
MSWPSKKCNKIQPMVKNKDEVLVAKGFGESSYGWSISADEDYIVLCLKEDETFDDVKDNKDINLRHVNRKLKYEVGEEQVRNLNIHEKRSSANEQHSVEDCITLSKEEEEKEKVYPSRHGYKDSIRRVYQVDGVEDLGVMHAESSGSDQSKSSASSFAFPSLNWEWVESPVRMPKSEDQHIKKQRLRFVRFQCCRF